MRRIGIVCEYNPFHNGHEYQILKSRELLGGDSAIVCVMSGDFVQRGEAAAFSKFARAEAACCCGADLVVELPLPWVLSSAESFARGAVSILAALGAEYLSFGSECGALPPLERAAETIAAEEFHDKVKEIMERESRLSYAAARQRALETALGEEGAIISEPNNILGVEYIKAIRAFGSKIRPVTFARTGATHDGVSGTGSYRSAAEIRAMLARGENASAYIPQRAHIIFERETAQGRSLDRERLEIALLSRLRMFDEEYFEALRDAGNGAGRRLYEALRQGGGLTESLMEAKTRRYPLARMRRISMCAALGISADMAEGEPGYARILAANEKGCGLLGELRGKAAIPIVTKAAAVKQMPGKIYKVFAAGADAHDLYTLAYAGKSMESCGNDWRMGPRIVKNI